MKKYVAEFIGTAILVLFGCGTAVSANAMFSAMGMLPVAFTTLLIAVAFGLSLTVIIYLFGHISGAHVNPAVSLAMLITKRMSGKDFAGYVVAQILGAIAGAGLLAFFIGGTATLGANGYSEASTFGIGLPVCFVMEIVLTFVFVLAVLTISGRSQNGAVSGLIIGGALTLVHLLGIPFTGTSVNPARSIGPALIQAFNGTEAIMQVWAFIAAPLIGGAIAAGAYIFFSSEEDSEDDDTLEIPLDALTSEEIEEIKAIGEENGVEIDVTDPLEEICEVIYD